MKAKVYIRLKEGVLDVQGQVVKKSLINLGFEEVEDVRIGKLVELKLSDGNPERVREMCEKLLANPVVEDYQIEMEDEKG